MTTLAQLAVPALPVLTRKHSIPCVPSSFKRISILNDSDAYFGEGLEEVDTLDPLNDVKGHKTQQPRRSALDYVVIDAGEKYLDDVYRDDDDRGNVHDGGYSSDGQQSIGSKKKGLAWQKVRQHLVEEEEKAAMHKKIRPNSAQSSVDGYSECGQDTDTVRLLDILAGRGIEDLGSTNSASSELSRSDIEYAPQTFPSRFDRMGNRLVQFLHRKPTTEEQRSDATRSWISQSSSTYDGSRSTRWLLETLRQVTKACQGTELSDGAIAQVSSHLTTIDRIVRQDVNKHMESAFRRVSSTQLSSDYELRDPMILSSLANHRTNAFKTFISAQDLGDTLAAFNNLVVDCGLDGVRMNEPWHVYFHIRNAVYSRLGFRQKQLFRLLDARFNMDVYKQRPVSNKRVCVVGTGPVGLRAAVELALLGGHVSVLEKRTKFSRENRLHLWPWVVQDLASLGAKVLFKNFCKSRTYFHVSTRQLQVILLKVALLIGVKVHSATGFQAIVPPAPEKSGGNAFYSIKTEPPIPEVEYTAVLGATGVNDQLAEPAGINRFVFSQKESLGLVCYFPNLETTEETKVKEFSWTAQLKHHMLHKMREVGIDLENIVYFRGEMHYLVMTPKRNNLLVRGVVKQNYPNSKDLVESTNIGQDGLHAFVKRVVDFAGIPRKTDFTRVDLFDFSSLTCAEEPASILTSRGKKLYIGLIGDSLQQPVWHEGVGICRGFLGALDGVWMVAQIGKISDEQLLVDRELAYEVMQRVSGRHRDKLQKNVRNYTVEPRSRYVVDFSKEDRNLVKCQS